MPAIAWARGQPGERGEHAGDAGANHRRLPADSEHVGDDRADGDALRGQPRDPEEIREHEHGAGQKGDVLTGDGEQVIEPCSLEALLQLVGEPLVLAQHDSREHGSTLALESRRDRAGHVGAQPVREPTDPTAPSDDAPVPAAKNHVNPAPHQPAPLVEAAPGRARRDDRRPQGEDRALRRGTTERQLEEDGLSHPLQCEATRLSRHPQRESSPPGRSCDHDLSRARAAYVGGEDAPVESFESGAPPPPADERERDDERRRAHPGR